jgi:hypothetical protein
MMRFRTIDVVRRCLFAAIPVVLAGGAQASLIFDAGAGNNTTSRSADNGPGTGVSVSTTTTLTQMAMSLKMPNGGDIKYMIWDGTDANLLFSETQAVAASGTTSYVLSTLFSFTLDAGSTYYFGVIGDNNLLVDFMFPPTTVTQNGLTSLNTGNSNYNNFANPTPAGFAGATITLQLFGDQTAIPEPSAFVPVAMGLGVFLLRKRVPFARLRS